MSLFRSISSLLMTTIIVLAATLVTHGNEPPRGAWQTGGVKFRRDRTIGGRSNVQGAVAMSHQKMSATLEIVPYKFRGNDPRYDYYLFTGVYRHGVRKHQTHALSVGYYADFMLLYFQCRNGELVDYGPETTLGKRKTEFSVGPGLSLGGGGADAGVSAEYSVSYETNDVQFKASADRKSIRWEAELPGAQGLDDPRPASSSGYTWRPAAIFRVPKGEKCTLRIAARVRWGADWPRLKRYDNRAWEVDEWFVYGVADRPIERTITPPPTLAAGQRVLVNYYPAKDAFWYPATISQVVSGKFYVKYDDGTVEWTTQPNLSRDDLKVGDAVQGDWKRGNRWYPGVIAHRSGSQVRIRYDHGVAEDTTLAAVRVKRK